MVSGSLDEGTALPGPEIGRTVRMHRLRPGTISREAHHTQQTLIRHCTCFISYAIIIACP